MVIVYVGGLTKDITEESLREFFDRRVQVKDVEINRKHVRVFDSIKGAPVFAFLDCACNEDQLARVLAYNRCYWNGAYLRVQVAKKGPYVYTAKTLEGKPQAGVQELLELNTELDPHCATKHTSVEPEIQPGTTPRPTEDTKAPSSRRKRVRIFNTLRPSACS